jgi:hypothetical protein
VHPRLEPASDATGVMRKIAGGSVHSGGVGKGGSAPRCQQNQRLSCNCETPPAIGLTVGLTGAERPPPAPGEGPPSRESATLFSVTSFNKFNGTSAAPEVPQNSPVKAGRDHYFDVAAATDSRDRSSSRHRPIKSLSFRRRPPRATDSALSMNASQSHVDALCDVDLETRTPCWRRRRRCAAARRPARRRQSTCCCATDSSRRTN